ncbi:MAG: hypothetical protein DCC67_14585 [Planctomycetota bacterium]|nr:MAG: hypothetical protein DCC67_14585 [Planctomycetota bacterium]
MTVSRKPLALITALVGALAVSTASADLVFHDDFEGETIDANPDTPIVGDPWVNIGTLTGHTISANPLVDADNPSSLVLKSHRAGGAAGRAFIDLTLEQSARIQAGELLTVRFQHYQPDPSRSSIAFAIYQNDFFDFSENAVDVEFHVNREVKHYKDAINNFETTGLFGTDGWDEVELIVDYAADRWSVSLNGGTPVGNLPFRNDGDYMTAATLLISPSVSQMTGYTDNIRVYIGAVPTPTTNADFDADGDVDGDDLLRWQRGFGIASGATLGQGDADGNGAVDAADLAAWKTKFGGPAVAAVPEPAALAPAAVAAAACAAALRRPGRRAADRRQ